MTVKEIKEKGKLKQIESYPELCGFYREYWEYNGRIYLIDDNNEIEESYEVD